MFENKFKSIIGELYFNIIVLQTQLEEANKKIASLETKEETNG